MSSQAPPLLAGIRVLIAEDSPTQALRLRHFLEKAGAEIAAASDGEEALALAAQLQPQVIVSDVMMPHKDGFALCRAIRQIPALSTIPIILLTTLSDTADILRGLEAGASSFLVKPFEETILVSRVHQLATRHMPAMRGDSFTLGATEYIISTDKAQVIDFLIASYEEAAERNRRLQQLNDSLQEMRDQLTLKNAELETLNATKNQFLGMAAHDLRNPLNIVTNYTEIIMEDAADRLRDEEMQFLQIIHSASCSMTKMVSDLLDFSKIESGTLNLRYSSVDLSQFISEIADRNRVFAARSAMQIICEIAENLPAARLDPYKMEQVLNNLLGNAIKYSDPGTSIKLRVLPEDDKCYTITVEDHGHGIPETDLETIFHPFQRASGKEPQVKGTGLGLAIVRKIVECHGGTVRVSSQLGRGSTFVVSLPFAPGIPCA
jgi:signal transduction histidine kinase